MLSFNWQLHIERRIGFWFAFFIPIIIYLILPVVLWYFEDVVIDTPPEGSVLKLPKLLESLIGGWVKRLRNGTFWDYAAPTEMESVKLFYKEQPPFNSRTYNKLRGTPVENLFPIT